MIEFESKNRFPKLAAELEPAVHKTLIETTRALQQEIGSRAPGHRIRKSLRRRQTAKYTHEIRGVWWWHFVNNGTRRQPARPFAQPAIVAQRTKFMAALSKLFDE